MIFLPNFSSKNLELTLDNIEQIQPIAHALSTTLRLKILQLIQGRGMSAVSYTHLDVYKRQALDAAQTMLFMPDLLAYCLTGVKGVEYTLSLIHI